MQKLKPVPPFPFQFEVLKDFLSSETQSSYATGLRYTVRDGNVKLANLAILWAEEGKVKILDSAPGGADRQGGPAQAAGRGTVS